MRLVDEQRRLRERGRIRIGYSTTNERGKKVPHKLDRFRFTSTDRSTVEQVAAVYGGQVEPWSDGGRNEWQATTDARELAVVFVTGGVSFSQSREQWQGGHLVRMCDGETAYIPSARGRFKQEACSCDLDGEPVCKLSTHLSMILPHLPGLGQWRLVSHGHNAAAELAGSVDLIESGFAAGLWRVNARLLIEVRERRRIVDDKPIVRKFAVPVLELDQSVAALGSVPSPSPRAALDDGPATVVAALPAGTSPPVPAGWAPVDQAALAPAPVPDVREQLARVEEPRKRRKNSPPPLPPTGLAPRTAAQAEADESPMCSICNRAYGTDPLTRNPGPGSKFIHKACAAGGGVEVPAASQEPAGRAGTSSGEHAVEPRPAGTDTADSEGPAWKRAPARRPRMLSAAQHRKCFALMAEAFPAWEGATADEIDAWRKAAQLGIAVWAGAPPDISSRQDIPASVADPLIQALERCETGEWTWAGDQLRDSATGNPVEFTEEGAT